MSGPIRKMIGPAKARLQQYIESANSLLENKPKEQELDEYESEVEDFLSRLTTNVSLLEKCNKDWSNILKETKGDAKVNEEKEYSRATDGENGFIEVMFIANEVISRLKARVTLISRKREQFNYQKMLSTTQTNLQPIIEHATIQATREVQAANLTSHPTGGTTASNMSHLSVHLPKLQLPLFDGNVLKWPEFWDTFNSSVHQQNIPNVSKFSYLRGVLRGAASVAISGISLTEENYAVALKLLQEKFGSKESIVEMLYSRLQSLPTSSSKFSDIQYTHNNVERILRQLESQGEIVDNQRTLVYQILSKFPLEVILKLESSKQCDQEWTMELLRKLLNTYVTIQENAYRRVAGAKGKVYDHRSVRWEGGQKDNRGSGRQFLNPASVDTFATNVQRRGKGPNCVFCKGDHYNDECDRVKTLVERKQKLINQGRCFLCFRVGHTFAGCSSPQRSGCFYCGKKQHHNRAICPQKFGDGEVRKTTVSGQDVSNVVTEENQDKPTDTLNASVGTDQALVASGERVLLQTAVVPIQTADGLTTVMVKVLLDSASHRTFMTDQLAKRLKLTSERKELLSVSTFAAKTPQQVNTFVVHFNLITKNKSCLQLHANVINKITGPIQRGPIQSSDLDFLSSISPDRMADTVPRDTEPVNVDLLIGSDYFWTIVGTEKLTLPSGLFLISSKIGYILTGRYIDTSCQQHVSNCLVMTEFIKLLPEISMVYCSEDLVTGNTCIEDFWRLEAIGICDPLDITDDDKALDRFNSSIRFEKGRYQVQWPWKYEKMDIPDNFEIAVGRLRSLARRLQRDRNLLQKYDEVISSQAEQGIVEKVTTDTRTSEPHHYLPHHPVITPAKNTTKLRIVYDASAKIRKGEKSLNECLHRGPVLLPDLCGILLRFRIQPIVILADIEKAFLQVGIQEEDRDVTRFLWFKNLNRLEVVEENLDTYRFCRVPFGIVCSPFLLGGTVKYHLKKIGTPVALQISENIYVDNVLLGAGNVEEAYGIYLESKSIFGKASMNLREWISNSPEFLKMLPESEIVKGSVIKTFGMPWNCKEDNLQVGGANFSVLGNTPTKREVLKAVARVFDPLGLVTPVTFFGKVFLQELWMESVSWDEPLSERLRKRWYEILTELKLLSTVKIERCVASVNTVEQYKLLVFCDASMKSYAAVVYLRVEKQSSVRVNLIFSKMRLVSKSTNKLKKDLTLPRLELLAVNIGIRAANFVVRELRLPSLRRIVWTDSTCVLHWLKTNKPLPTFVENRVKEVLKESDVTFRYIPSNQNPADLPTRGLLVSQVKESKLWWHGPAWLTDTESLWPEWCVPQVTPEILRGMECVPSRSLYEVASVTSHDVDKVNSVCGIDESKYSSLRRLLRVTVYCLKFIKRRAWLALIQSRRESIEGRCKLLSFVLNSLSDGSSVCAGDLQVSTLLWVFVVQKRKFADVFIAIVKNRKHCLIHQLGLRLDEYGVLRCYGRFLNAETTDSAKCPKLLSRHEVFTRLLIKEVHERLIHAGVAHTLSQIREEYWIPQGRVAVRSVLSCCLICRRHEGAPFPLPLMPPWPCERVARSDPFQFTGLDYLGPLYVKEGSQLHKVWVCLFTCLTVRAVHLEWVLGLTAEQFLNCLKRFISRRGKPDSIISDNAPQFKLTNTVLNQQWRTVFTDQSLLSYVSSEGIRWSFTTALAPWQGGLYERLVGMVKRCLRKALGKKHFTLEQLATLLTEIEAVLNSRPLTYVYEDFQSGFTLTPSHFLVTNRKLGLPSMEDGCCADEDYQPNRSTATQLLMAWKKGQKYLDLFWKVWRGEYLLSLRENLPIHHKNSERLISRVPKIDDVVLIKDDNIPRCCWRLGRIKKLIPGHDDQIRSADILLPNGGVITRAICHLYPLELPSMQDEPPRVTDNGSEDNTTDVNGQEQSVAKCDNEKRKAHLIARQRIQKCLRDNGTSILFVLPGGCQDC